MQAWAWSRGRAWTPVLALGALLGTAAPLLADPQRGRPAPVDARRVPLDEALRLGADRAPAVGAARAPESALPGLGRAARLGIHQLPYANLYLGNRSSPRPGDSGLEAEVQALVTVPLLGLAKARGGVADATRGLVAADVRRARFDGALRAGLAWVSLLEAEEVLHVRRDMLAEAERLVTLVGRRVQAGIAPGGDLRLVEGERGMGEVAVLGAEGDLVVAEAELRTSVASDDDHLSAAGVLCRVGEEPPADVLAERLAEARRASGARAVAEAKRVTLEREQRVTRATQGASLGIGGTYLHEGTGDQIVMGLVQLPLPFFDPSAWDRAQREIEARTAAGRVAEIEAETDRAVRLAVHEREHAREVRRTLEERVVAPLAEAVRLDRLALEAGATDLAPLLLARQRLAQAMADRVKACGDVQRADLRLRYLTGRLLEGGSP